MPKRGYEIFKNFEQKKDIYEEDVPLLIDYICHQLNCGYRVRKFYGYSHYASKFKIVLRYKKKTI